MTFPESAVDTNDPDTISKSNRVETEFTVSELIKWGMLTLLIVIPDVVIVKNDSVTVVYIFSTVLGLTIYDISSNLSTIYNNYNFYYILFINLPKYTMIFDIYQSDLKSSFFKSQRLYRIFFMIVLQLFIYGIYALSIVGKWYIISALPLVPIGILILWVMKNDQ